MYTVIFHLPLKSAHRQIDKAEPWLTQDSYLEEDKKLLDLPNSYLTSVLISYLVPAAICGKTMHSGHWDQWKMHSEQAQILKPKKTI